MRRSSQGWVLGAVGLALAAGLTACDSDDSPRPATSTRSASNAASPTTTATRSTTTPPPTTRTVAVPPEATKHSEAGAKAFVKYFVDEVSESSYTADSTRLRGISGSACKGCKSFFKIADEFKAKGQHVDRPPLSLHGQIVLPKSTDDQLVIDALIVEVASKVVDRSGTVVSEQGGSKFTLRNTVGWAGGRWTMVDSLLVTN